MLDPKQMIQQLGIIAAEGDKTPAMAVSQLSDDQWSSIIQKAKDRAVPQSMSGTPGTDQAGAVTRY
jgi:hypothetical protein